MQQKITIENILLAYENGIFPMAENRNSPDIHWIRPTHRGIIPLTKFHTSRSLQRALNKKDYDIRINTQFNAVISACADRSDTWISHNIIKLYTSLYEMGYAHSYEVFRNNTIIGGVYGVALGGVFCGESMFSHATNGSKIALFHLVKHLKQQGFILFDVQFQTPHLKTLGCIEITQDTYIEKLKKALQIKAIFDSHK